jgi:uncharacterized protein YbbC (DUF1343 family)
MKRFFTFLFLIVPIVIFSECSAQTNIIKTGAEQTEEYIPLIRGKVVGLVANQTSMVKSRHLVDTLLSLGINIKVIFAPEHGFRNMADAGETITDGRDPITNIPLISLYGNHFKPTSEDMKGLDYVIFDIQDVGARFYTYISTMHYVMEACAENNVKLIILDRPNPNGFYFDGAVLDTAYRSFVGMHPVPIVHGMTVGEYATMIIGEGWLKDGIKCDLVVIRCSNYEHQMYYELPVKPSPNLPNQTSVYLYPSLCFFEGTPLSCGRGTPFPFQLFGDPYLPDEGFAFTPESLPGAKNPPCLGMKCYGTDLHNALKDGIVPSPGINLSWIIKAYNQYPYKEKFFIPYFDVLAGGPQLREQIQKGMTEKEIKATWEDGLKKFSRKRAKYLLY